jgi:hypothetical protein
LFLCFPIFSLFIYLFIAKNKQSGKIIKLFLRRKGGHRPGGLDSSASLPVSPLLHSPTLLHPAAPSQGGCGQRKCGWEAQRQLKAPDF